MFGKPVETPRNLSSMFDPNFKLEAVGKPWDENTKWYKAGGLWTPLVKKIVDKIEKITGRNFLYAQLNHYQDDKDYIGYHTDSEVQDNGLVVSLSIGATRRFVFRDKTKKTGQPDYEIYLPDGSLIIIDQDAIKNKYKHALTKVRKADNYSDARGNGRINITFRTS
jgi:alkylated DNA repair dioxygenase AlkB